MAIDTIAVLGGGNGSLTTAGDLALGFASHHYPLSDHYDQTGENEWMYGRRAHTDLVESESWREPLDFDYRYIGNGGDR